MTRRFFYNSVASLPVQNLRETISFYKKHLGFCDEWYWGDPPTDGGCRRDQLSLLFNENPAFARKIRGFEIVFFVDDVDGLYADFLQNPSLDIISPLRDEPWGTREFTIRDINGYSLRVSCSVERIRKLAAIDSVNGQRHRRS